jgi:hypothetical protein
MSTIKRGLTFVKHRGLYSLAFLAALAFLVDMATGKTYNLQSSLKREKNESKKFNLEAAPTAADFNLTNGVIYLKPAFVPAPLDADTTKTKTMVTNFISANGLDIEKIALNATTCMNRFFEINTIYLPVMNARVA